MPRKFVRRDFVIKDLAISVAGGGRGGTWLPGPDQETPPSPISPIASVLVNNGLIDIVRNVVQEAMKTKNFESITRAFIDGDPGGNPAIRTAIRDIGAAVVASAAYSALGGGAVGLVDPDRSFETIPPHVTPIVHKGFEVHRVSELPRLQRQLAEALTFVDKALAAQAPQGAEVGEVRTKLEGALKNLPRS
jgi:hypothetical protein